MFVLTTSSKELKEYTELVRLHYPNDEILLIVGDNDSIKNNVKNVKRLLMNQATQTVKQHDPHQ